MAHAAATGGPAWQEAVHQRERWTRLLEWYGIEADPLDVGLSMPDKPSAVPAATVIHPGAGYGSRLWPAERFSDVARHLADAGHTVVLPAAPASGSEPSGSPGRPVFRTDRSWREPSACRGSPLWLRMPGSSYRRTPARRIWPRPTAGPPLCCSARRTGEWGPPPGPHIVLERAELRRGDPFAADPDPALLGVASGTCWPPSAGLSTRVRVQQPALKGHEYPGQAPRNLHLGHTETLTEICLAVLAKIPPIQQFPILGVELTDGLPQAQQLVQTLPRFFSKRRGDIRNSPPALVVHRIKGIRAHAGRRGMGLTHSRRVRPQLGRQLAVRWPAPQPLRHFGFLHRISDRRSWTGLGGRTIQQRSRR